MSELELLLAAAFFVVAALYASVGHAGASGYIAVMALASVAPATLRPTALLLNVLVATVGIIRYARAGMLPWRRLWPFVLASAPAAYVAARWPVDAMVVKLVLAVVLLASAIELWRSAARAVVLDAEATPPAIWQALLTGGGIGVISGISGTGGAIFFSPLVLLFRWSETRAASGLAAGFVLVNSVAGLAGIWPKAVWSPATPWWLLAVFFGAMVGTELGTKRLRIPHLRRVLAIVLVVAAAKLGTDGLALAYQARQ